MAGAPSTLTIDPNRLIQILTNLAHNAVKFSPDDVPVRIRWSAPADGTIVFEVIDRGAGIPPEEQALIFERFRQRGDHRSHAEGFGLGLYITKLLTEAMGGWLTLTSSPEGHDLRGHASGDPPDANTRSTVRSNAVGLNGFVKYSSAPNRNAAARPSSPVAVTTITRIDAVAGSVFTACKTSAPLVPGILRSRNSRSGGASRIRSIAR